MEYIKIIEKEILKVGVFTIDDWVWNDNDTLVLTTKPFFEGTDDENHLEVEYHRDSHEFTFTKVYAHETMPYNLREEDKRKFIDDNIVDIYSKKSLSRVSECFSLSCRSIKRSPEFVELIMGITGIIKSKNLVRSFSLNILSLIA